MIVFSISFVFEPTVLLLPPIRGLPVFVYKKKKSSRSAPWSEMCVPVLIPSYRYYIRGVFSICLFIYFFFIGLFLTRASRG